MNPLNLTVELSFQAIVKKQLHPLVHQGRYMTCKYSACTTKILKFDFVRENQIRIANIATDTAMVPHE